MSNSSAQIVGKQTIAPLDAVDWRTGLKLPVPITPGLNIEDVTGRLRPENFELWRDYLSKDDRDRMPSARIAIVHRFASAEHLGREEEASKVLVERVFKCLRIVKPTKMRFSAVQYKLERDRVDVFRFTHPTNLPLVVPDAEVLNRVNASDFQKLRGLLPLYLRVIDDGPAHLQRAIGYFEASYSFIPDPVLQFLTWMMGIEAIASPEEAPKRQADVIRELQNLVNLEENIYEDSQLSEYQMVPTVSLSSVIEDLFKLRNHLVHGGWVPQEWGRPITRTNLSGHIVEYADVLREAATVALRKSITASLQALTLKAK